MNRRPSDTDLMALASGGSVDAFALLYDRYSDRAYRVARSVCSDDESAQAAVHEAFLYLWQHRSSHRSRAGTIRAWLLVTVRARAVKLDSATTDRNRAGLARLPDAEQEAISLALYGELSHTEISTHLGLASATVRRRMRLGLQKLRAGSDQVVA